jgi:16S rRNA (cytosine1402-N4)-methyltransferase
MGGHAEALLDASGSGVRLLGLDRDPGALGRARRRLSRFGERVVLKHADFRDLSRVVGDAGVERAQSVLLDLGVSSLQLEDARRGFSFQADGPLDMRFDPSAGVTAAELLGRLSEAELARLIGERGEEPHARRIAREIVSRRRAGLRTTAELVAAVKAAVPRRAWPKARHVATRTFQAIRMAVNQEVEALTLAVPAAVALLAPGGRLGVISFHSVEDRVVKRAFRTLAAGPYAALEPAPITPCREERRANPRCRSAKLRVLARLGEPHGAR